jgi:Flp pilus assembly protein protease CpaA
MTIARYVVLLTLGMWIAWVDLRSRRIPNSLLLIMLGLSTFIYVFNIHQIVSAVLTLVIFALLLLPISLIRSRSLGAGDSKLILVLAVLLGRGDRMMSALICASFAALIQISFTYIKSRRWPGAIPFAPALICGALLVV